MRYLRFVVLLLAASALAGFNFPEPHRFVTDAAGVVTAADKVALDTELTALEQDTGWEVYVVTVPNMGGAAVERYAQEVFVHYGVGKKDKNNGVLFLVAKDERKARIHTGYHAESVITDAMATRIVREHVAPKTKANDWSGGIAAGTRAVAATIREHHSKATAAPERQSSGASAGLGIAVGAVVALGVGIVAAIALSVRRAKKREAEEYERINRDHEEWLARQKSHPPNPYAAAAAVAAGAAVAASPAPIRTSRPSRSSARKPRDESSSSSSSSSSYDYGSSSSSSS
jgi:uncharacterized membrane protein YgcG